MSTERDRLGWLIKRAQHGHHRALDAGLSCLGVTLVQWNALREIDRNPGDPQLRLAERTFNSAQAFGTLLTRLTALGLVERSPGVGRATVHRLTTKGKALLRKGQVVMGQVLDASFAPLSKADRAELARLLTLLVERKAEHG